MLTYAFILYAIQKKIFEKCPLLCVGINYVRFRQDKSARNRTSCVHPFFLETEQFLTVHKAYSLTVLQFIQFNSTYVPVHKFHRQWGRFGGSGGDLCLRPPTVCQGSSRYVKAAQDKFQEQLGEQEQRLMDTLTTIQARLLQIFKASINKPV